MSRAPFVLKRIFALIVVAIVVVLSTAVYRRWVEPWLAERDGDGGVPTSPHSLAKQSVADPSDVPNLMRMSKELQNIAQKVHPSVVAIEGRGGRQTAVFSPEKLAFSYDIRVFESIGSGVLVSKEGHIVTNNHVTQDQSRLMVRFSNGKRCAAEKIGVDSVNDVAVLKVNSTEEFNPLFFGDSDKVQIGQMVLSVGNAYGMGMGFSRGMISAKKTYALSNKTALIQTDSSTHPGHSGGPLLNVYGEMIGLTTKRLLDIRNGTEEGIASVGFAIPSNIVLKAFKDICEYPRWVFHNLGVGTLNFDDIGLREIYDYLKIPEHVGIPVDAVIANSSAAHAGIKKGDVIVSCGGHPVRNYRDLKKALKLVAGNEFLDLVVWRGWKGESPGGKVSFRIRIINNLDKVVRFVMESDDLEFFGLQAKKMTLLEETQYHCAGLIVKGIKFQSMFSGKLKPEDVIEKINGHACQCEEHIVRIFSEHPSQLDVVYTRDGVRDTVSVNVPDKLQLTQRGGSEGK